LKARSCILLNALTFLSPGLLLRILATYCDYCYYGCPSRVWTLWSVFSFGTLIQFLYAFTMFFWM